MRKEKGGEMNKSRRPATSMVRHTGQLLTIGSRTITWSLGPLQW